MKMEAFFWTLVVLSQVFGLASVILLGVWISEYTGGYVWDCSNGVGGYHYLLMTISMAFLYGEGMLSFRVCHRLGLPYLAEKAIHATIQSIVVVLIAFGVHAAYLCKDSQTPVGKDLYSIHSWLGLATVVVFFGQWIYGIVMTILLRKVDRSWQNVLLPNHAFFGLLIFAMSIASCLTGANEMAILLINDYSQIVTSGHIVNAFSLVLVVFAAVTAYIAYKPDFQIPEDRRHPEDTRNPENGRTTAEDDASAVALTSGAVSGSQSRKTALNPTNGEKVTEKDSTTF